MSSPPSGPDYNWQPQSGDYKSAPTYGQPPRKNRGGLIIALIVVLVVVALGAIGLLAYRLVNDHRTTDRDPGSAAAAPRTTAGNPKPTTTRPTTAKPTAPRPTTARPRATGAAGATDLARRFVTQLNANNSKGAAAFACQGSEQLIPLLMRSLVGPPTKLTTGTPTGQAPTFVIPLSGTSKGAAVTGVLVINQPDPAPLCVRAFQITTTR